MTTTDLVKDFREILREEKAAKKFLVIEMVRSFDQSLRSPFTMIFAVAIKGATPLIIGWLGIASTLVNMLFSIPVGKLADKIGRKKTLILTRPIMYASFLTLIFAPSPEWLVLAWAEMGFPFEYMVWTTWEMETVSADKRGRWSGFLNLARNLVSIPAPIIGGLLYQFNPYILFVMPIILDLGIKLPLIIKCPETLRNRSEDPL